jgi:hypothetical protein
VTVTVTITSVTTTRKHHANLLLLLLLLLMLLMLLLLLLLMLLPDHQGKRQERGVPQDVEVSGCGWRRFGLTYLQKGFDVLNELIKRCFAGTCSLSELECWIVQVLLCLGCLNVSSNP